MKTTLLSLACLCGWFQARSQTPTALLVTAELVGAGTYNCTYGLDGYYIKLALRNVTNDSRSFFVWNCSWQMLWESDKSQLYLWSKGCDQNFPERITLVPNAELVFYGFVVFAKEFKEKLKTANNKLLKEDFEVKFSFVEVQSQEDIRNIKSLSEHKVGKLYWSNSILFTFANNTYKVVAPPAK